jgi:hypothetical protein
MGMSLQDAREKGSGHSGHTLLFWDVLSVSLKLLDENGQEQPLGAFSLRLVNMQTQGICLFVPENFTKTTTYTHTHHRSPPHYSLLLGPLELMASSAPSLPTKRAVLG